MERSAPPKNKKQLKRFDSYYPFACMRPILAEFTVLKKENRRACAENQCFNQASSKALTGGPGATEERIKDRALTEPRIIPRAPRRTIYLLTLFNVGLQNN